MKPEASKWYRLTNRRKLGGEAAKRIQLLTDYEAPSMPKICGISHNKYSAYLAENKIGNDLFSSVMSWRSNGVMLSEKYLWQYSARHSVKLSKPLLCRLNVVSNVIGGCEGEEWRRRIY